MKASDLIKKVELVGNSLSGEDKTDDFVYCDSVEYLDKLDSIKRIAYNTDYAAMNHGIFSDKNRGYRNRKSTVYWLRSSRSFSKNEIINENGDIDDGNKNRMYSVRPVLFLNLAEFRSLYCNNNKFSKIKTSKNYYIDDFHTLTFGEYPKTYVGNKLNEMLESLLSNLSKTGKKWNGYLEDGKYIQNEEYLYDGERYVRVKTFRYDSDSQYLDGTKVPEDGTYNWVKVEPITWIIRNWNEMPREINPNGNGKADSIHIISEECIISGIQFSSKLEAWWENSCLRSFLNNDFLESAFSIDISIKKEGYKEREKTKIGRYNPYGFIFDKLLNDDLLNLYIESNSSIFLHGPSGVGKSERVKQLDPTATRITLRPQMNPEEIDGTLDRETGNYIPPLWYTKLCEKCKAEPERNHVLFIDELTNVKPTVQSLVYSIVLDRAGKDGLWPLPENTVVVAAGNESADNLAAYPLTNALFRRFCHIYFKVDKEDWINWATGVSTIKKQKKIEKTNEPCAKIHPAIISYIMNRNVKYLNQGFDEENPSIVTDPRKWEIASKVLYSTKNPKSLLPAIGEILTADFTEFVRSRSLIVEDIINNNYSKEEIQEIDNSKKIAIISSLSMAEEKDLPLVRKFVAETMGKEMLASYDVMWIRNDKQREKIIIESNIKLIEEDKNNVNEY